MAKVSLRFSPYMRGAPEWREVDATVCGALAVHRWAMLRDDGELSFCREWRVSHIATGDSVMLALPNRFRDRGAVTARKRDLIEWANAFQLAAPEFFAAVAAGEMDKAAGLATIAMTAGQAL